MTQQAIIDFLNDFNPSGIALTPEQVATLTTQLREQVNQLSVSVPNAQGATTVLYSGQIGNGVHSGAVAQALADASPGQIATIDQTEVAALLDARNDAFHQALRNALGNDNAAYNRILNGTDITGQTRIATDSLWDAASQRFVANATGDVRTITPLADATRVFSQTEVRALLNNPNVTSIDGVPKSHYEHMVTAALGENLSQADAYNRVSATMTQVSSERVAHLQFPVDAQGNIIRDASNKLSPIGTADYFSGTSIKGANLPDDVLRTSGGNLIHSEIESGKVPANAHILQNLGEAKIGIDQLKQYDALNNGGRLLNKLGIIGDVIALGLVAHDANAAYMNGDTAGAEQILKDGLLDYVGGLAGGLAAAELVGSALLPLYATGPAGAIIAGSLTLLAGILGGIGGEAMAHQIADFFSAAQHFVQRRDPLTLDLDGDGIETIPPSSTNPILFDHDGDGVKSGTGWIKPDDGFLVLDRNGNGTIDDGTELFGDSTPLLDTAGNVTGKAVDGFDALAQQDSNGDGVVNSSDANWNNLRVWQDLNQDGISQANELKTLDELGIASINVGKTEHSKVLPGGNEIADLGTYTRTDGTTGGTGAASGLADVNLADDTFHREFTDHLDTSAVAGLPDMQGSGAVRDLREAASQFPELAATLAQLGANTTREQLKAAVGVILQQWADSANFSDSFETAEAQNKDLFFIPPGVSALDAYNARYAGLLGAYSGINNGSPSGLSLTNDLQAKFDNIRSQQDRIERLLKTLEAFNGRDFAPIASNSGSTTLLAFSTSAPAGGNSIGSFGIDITVPVMYNMEQARLNLLTQSYNSLVSSVYDALIMQTRLKPYLDSISLTVTDGGIGLDFSALDSLLANQHAVNANTAVGDLLELRRLMGDKLEASGWDGLALLADWAVTDASDPAVLGTLAEFGYSGGIHTDAAGQVDGGNANDIVAGQAYDPVTGSVRILVGFVPIFMPGRTGLAENGGQWSKQAANDKKWRIAA
jgi:hypothetical protein